MKANEFVKKYGWERAKAASKMHIADFCIYFDLPMSFIIDMRDELKRLIESNELVNDHGGLEGAKCYVDSHDLYEAICDEYGNICDYVSNVDLIDAIADVESCQ